MFDAINVPLLSYLNIFCFTDVEPKKKKRKKAVSCDPVHYNSSAIYNIVCIFLNTELGKPAYIENYI